jgi:alpha-glucosidase
MVLGPVLWWKGGIIYQIYPRSFQDSNSDGIGDLNGIERRLDYLQWLGIDAVWISPVYPSPMADFGYDITDYCAIDPRFGTLADFDRLIARAHQRKIRVILDFVPNHTSEEHPWFVESRSARTSRKRDWYIWRDPAPDSGPPNNWISQFGGPAWTFDPATGQYYLHSFLPQQPDLNWRNADVQDAMFTVLRFWLDRGVDGFRVDVIWLLIKDDQFRDNPINAAFRPSQRASDRTISIYNADRPEVHGLIAKMRRVIDSYDERVLIGEIYLPLERLVTYYGENLSGANLPFNFGLVQAAWNAKSIANLIRDYEEILPAGGWPNWVLGNHDQPRIAERIGDEQARIAAMLLLTLRGTPTMYYGDELGIAHVAVPHEVAQDPWEKNEPGLGRDPYRTPMQWDSSPHAGFSTVAPWLPVEHCYQVRNVVSLSNDSRSLLSLYKRLIRLRKTESVLQTGSAKVLNDSNVLIYERRNLDKRIIVALNFGAVAEQLPWCDIRRPRLLLSTHLDRDGLGPLGILRPNEGLIISDEIIDA